MASNNYRLLSVATVLCLSFLGACDTSSTPSAQISSNGMKLHPPFATNRELQEEVLFAELKLDYESNGIPQSTTVTAERSAQSGAWESALLVPDGIPFSITITWYDLADGERLDLSTGTRRFPAMQAGTRDSLQFELTDFDPGGFNEDQDVPHNLQERLDGTSPYDANDPDPSPGTDPLDDRVIPVAFREDTSTTISIDTIQGFTLDGGWSVADVTPTDPELCNDNDETFEILIAETDLTEACLLEDDCDLTFDRIDNTTDDDSDIRYEIGSPDLIAPAVVARNFTLVGTDGETRAVKHVFCINALNAPPAPADDAFTVLENEVLVITADSPIHLLSNDTDAPHVSNSPLQVLDTPVRAPALASEFRLGNDGGFTYKVNAEQLDPTAATHTDSFEYAVTDGTFERTAVATLEIVTVDLPPVALRPLPVLDAIVGITRTLALNEYFEDPEGSNLLFEFEENDILSVESVDISEAGLLSITARSGDEGSHTGRLLISDQTHQITAELPLLIIENLPPVVIPLSNPAPIAYGDALGINAAERFSDPENQPLRYSLSTAPVSTLSINPDTGFISGQLTSAGTYQLSVFASDGINEAAVALITLTQQDAPSGTLSVDTDRLDLQANRNQRTDRTITLSNVGDAASTFTLQGADNWLGFSIESGTVQPGESSAVQVSATCPSDPGEYNTILSITSPRSGSFEIPITLTCLEDRAPVLSVVQRELNLDAESGESDSGSVNVSNTGTADLSITVSDDRSWLAANVEQATLEPQESMTLQVSGSCAALDEGEYEGNVTIASTSDEQSESILVRLQCSAPSVVQISEITPASVPMDAFVFESDSARISFRNSGDLPLDYQLEFSADWLSASNETGTLGIGETADIELTGQCGEEPANINYGEALRTTLTVTVPATGQQEQTSVVLNCYALTPIFGDFSPSPLRLQKTVLDYDDDDYAAVTFMNEGNAPMVDAIAIASADWLDVELSSSEIAPGETATVYVHAECGTSVESRQALVTIDGGTDSFGIPVLDSFEVILSCEPFVVEDGTVRITGLVFDAEDGSIFQSTRVTIENLDADLRLEVFDFRVEGNYFSLAYDRMEEPAQREDCNRYLLAGDSCYVTVLFEYGTEGLNEGTIDITYWADPYYGDPDCPREDDSCYITGQDERTVSSTLKGIGYRDPSIVQ